MPPVDGAREHLLWSLTVNSSKFINAIMFLNNCTNGKLYLILLRKWINISAMVPPRLFPCMIMTTRLWPNDCSHTRLCSDTNLLPYITVPRHVCPHTRLCPDMIVHIHDSAQTRLFPDTLVGSFRFECLSNFNVLFLFQSIYFDVENPKMKLFCGEIIY